MMRRLRRFRYALHGLMARAKGDRSAYLQSILDHHQRIPSGIYYIARPLFVPPRSILSGLDLRFCRDFVGAAMFIMVPLDARAGGCPLGGTAEGDGDGNRHGD